jgi:hypothetical protein
VRLSRGWVGWGRTQLTPVFSSATTAPRVAIMHQRPWISSHSRKRCTSNTSLYGCTPHTRIRQPPAWKEGHGAPGDTLSVKHPPPALPLLATPTTRMGAPPTPSSASKRITGLSRKGSMALSAPVRPCGFLSVRV